MSAVDGSTRCDDVLDPGAPWEHWCELEAGHAGDHSCADCGDVWNPIDPSERDWFGPELHERWEGTCPECVAERADLLIPGG